MTVRCSNTAGQWNQVFVQPPPEEEVHIGVDQDPRVRGAPQQPPLTPPIVDLKTLLGEFCVSTLSSKFLNAVTENECVNLGVQKASPAWIH